MSTVRRSLLIYAELRRRPDVMLRKMLELPELGEDLVQHLEERLAELLGKPRALFFPTGTMAQQVALRINAERTGRRAFTAHPRNHLDGWEQRGYAVVHGLRYHPAGDRERLLTAEDLAKVTEPVSTLLIELPQREIGGQLPFYDRPRARIAALFDSVYLSLYKGLEVSAGRGWTSCRHGCRSSATTPSRSRGRSPRTGSPRCCRIRRRRRCSTCTCRRPPTRWPAPPTSCSPNGVIPRRPKVSRPRPTGSRPTFRR